MSDQGPRRALPREPGADRNLAALQRVQDGLAEVASARTDVPRVRERLAVAIVTAYRDGTRVGEIAQITGYGREQVRRILRAGGVEAGDTGPADA